MKKVLFFSLFIIFLSFSLLSKATIKFKSATVDFGEVDQGKSAEVQFEFENAGDSLLTIKRVLPSCGCTAVSLGKKDYQPGEKGTLPIKFNSTGYYGRVSKLVTVHTNDEQNPTVRITLVGDVSVKNFSLPEIDQETLDFKEVKVGKRYTRKIRVKNAGTIDLEILDLFHDPEIVPEFTQSVIKPNQNAELILIFKPMRPGKFEKYLRCRTNSIKKRYLLVKVSAEVNE